MRGAFLLLRLSLRRVRTLLCATGLLLAVVQILRVRIAAEVHDTGQFNQLSALLPQAVRDVLGPSLAGIMSFNGIVSAVYFDTGFIIALLALAITLATLFPDAGITLDSLQAGRERQRAVRLDLERPHLRAVAAAAQDARDARDHRVGGGCGRLRLKRACHKHRGSAIGWPGGAGPGWS